MFKDKNEIAISCPNCGKERKMKIPGKFKCTSCGITFIIDKNQRCIVLKKEGEHTVEIYCPNKIPLIDRIASFVISIFLMGYGII